MGHQMNNANLLYSADIPLGSAHLSEEEAIRITQQEDIPELRKFVLALEMVMPTSTDKAATLLMHMVKEQMSMDAGLIADQMRNDHWDADLPKGADLMLLANRALAHLATHEGIELFNFFVKTFAKTSGSIYAWH